MLFSVALALAADPAQPEVRYQQGRGALEICGVSAPGSVELIQAVMALPDAKLLEQKDRYLTLVQENESRFWTFAINDHPAAPAIICRTIKLREDGGTTLAMEVSCFADKAPCDKLTADFVVHNQSLLDRTGGI